MGIAFRRAFATVTAAALAAVGSTNAYAQEAAPSARARVAIVEYGHLGVPSAEGENEAAFAEFQRRLKAYLEMRERLAGELEPLEPTADPAELVTRQVSLAEALRRARRDAKPGDLIPVQVADAIRAIVSADYEQRDPEARAATVHEAADESSAAVNHVYPPDAALSTMPPLLLAKLPVLPDNLQYRLVQRHVVLLDGDTQIVLDVVPNALPPF